MSLAFTGERYHPGETGPMRYEHLHRYAVCVPLVAGRAVLDIASGEGYGSALLAGGAASVVGVDLDAQAVRHAAARYARHGNLAFREGRADAIPLGDGTVDVAVSFETLEHHDRHDEMMAEMRRVLKPGGILVISSPDKRLYSDLPQYRNPFHVRELYRDEFDALLRRHFRHVRLYGQRLATVSAVCDMAPSGGETRVETLAVDGDGRLARGYALPGDPVYLIGVCGDGALPALAPSFFSVAGDDLYREQYRLQDELRLMQAGHVHLAGRCTALEDALAQRGRESAALRDELDVLRAAASAREAESAALRAQRDGMLASASWRITRPLRSARAMLAAARLGRGR